MKYKILIVDDEADIRHLIREYCENAGYEAEEAGDGLEALEMCENVQYDCIIADVMMPKLDGISMTKRIKEICDTPILMLSAKGEEYDKLFGFNAGVDDYVVKPFSPRELLARIKVILSRHEKMEKEIKKEILKFGEFKISLAGREVFGGNEIIPLTLKEFELLVYLAQNGQQVCTRDMILDAVWGDDYFGDDRVVDAQVKLLRGKLGAYRDLVKTVRGVGYKWNGGGGERDV